jgi:H+/gluconate symporter-like permease
LNTKSVVEALILAAIGGIIAFYGASYFVTNVNYGYSVTYYAIATVTAVPWTAITGTTTVSSAAGTITVSHPLADWPNYPWAANYIVAVIVALSICAIVRHDERFQILSRLVSRVLMRNEINQLRREVDELKRERDHRTRSATNKKRNHN